MQGTDAIGDRQSVLRVVLDNVAGGVLMVDGDQRIGAWNDEFQRLLGLPPGYLQLGRPLEELIRLQCRNGEFGAVDEDAFVRDYIADTPDRQVYERTRPDGTVLEFRRTYLAGGGYVAICTDVTERRRQQARVEEDARRTRRLLEGSPIGAAIGGRDSRLLFCNSEFARQAGTTKEALTGVDPASLWADPLERRRLFTELNRNGVVRRQEVSMKRADGTVCWVLVSLEPIEYEGAQAALCWTFDISELRQRTGELATALDRQTATGAILRAMVASPHDGAPVFRFLLDRAIALCEAVAGAIYQFDGTQLSMVATQNYPPAAMEILRKRFPLVPHRESLAGRALLDRTVVNVADLATEPGYGAGFRELTDSIGVHSTLAVPMMSGAEPVGVIAVHRAAPGRFPDHLVEMLRVFADQAVIAQGHARLFEELRAARDNAEAATRAKSTFLATMSHEIRTPMNGVLGMLELIQRTRLDGEQEEIVRVVRESASSLLKVIDDILDFSKIESGRLEIERVPLSPLAVVEGVADALATQAHKKKIQLTVFAHASVPPSVEGDPVRLRQVLFNLVGNAIKFTEHGEVAVRLSVEGATPDGMMLRTEVSDTGLGLAPEAISRLFEPFVQADGSTTRRFGGTGLGLSICRGLVERMGGEIGVRSTQGQGSTFWFTLAVGQHRAVPAEESDLSGLCVLVVEDNRTVQDVLQAYLGMAGVQVELVASAEAAFDLVGRYHEAGITIDAMVADLKLPGCDAFALRRRLMAEPGLPALPAVLLTAFDEPEHRRQAVELGFSAYLTKPVRRATLLRSIAAACGRQTAAADHDADARVTAARRVPTREAALAAGELVLVAEDNPTNQAVITRQLAELGYASDVADNGRKALDLFHTTPYGLVLTDIHMPEMDGLELSSAVREWSRLTDRRPVPVIALTADVVSGEAERWLAAGIDEYLRKPVDLAGLAEALGRLLPRRVAAESPPVTVAPAPRPVADAALDVDVLRRSVGVPDDALLRLLRRYVESTEVLVAAIESASRARDAVGLREAAHSMVGASRTAGAQRLATICSELETTMKAATTDWPRADGLRQRLRPALAAVQEAVERFGERAREQA